MLTFARKIILASLLLMSFALSATAQTALWSQRFGGVDNDEGHDLAIDPSDNVLITGAFTGPVDFGGGTLPGAGFRDVYVAKYASDGSHIWSKGFGNSNTQRGEAIASDASHNVIVAGDFSGQINFGGGILSSVGGWDMFLAKLDPSGNHVWSQRFGSTEPANADGARVVATDDSNNVYLAGYFSGTVDFGGGALVSDGGWDAFVAKYDSSGTHVWSKRLGSTGGFDNVTAMAVDDLANVVVTGRFSGTVDFGGGGLAGGPMFLVKYDSDGVHQWSQSFSANPNGVAVDADGNIAVTGGFDNVDFGGGPLAGPDNIYVVKFDLSGNHLWSFAFGSAFDQEWGEDAAFDDVGNLFVTGEFKDTMLVGSDLLASRGSNDPFVAAFEADGDVVWADVFGGPVAPGELGHTNDRTGGIGVDGSGDVYVHGWFDYTADFGLGTLTTAGERDIYLAKYARGLVSAAGDDPVRLRANALSHNIPNPFNPTTSIRFTLRHAEHVTIRIYDVSGRLVRTLVDGIHPAGSNEAVWNGMNNNGSPVSSGVYFYRMSTATFEQTRRMVLLK